ncbi:hypothetical protein ACFXOM_30175 [Streptomyces sp. NPDC059169]|uniref:hypothetical protein n=1 Tax=Streptomyces sp. NPDC059169 TaxID=3346754 RepID=UPI0036AA9D18
MNAENHELDLEWIPVSGFQLRKAGVHVDAVRVDGADGQRLADLMDRMTGGDPGPIVSEANGCRGVFFLLPPGSTAHRSWPRGVIRLNAAAGSVGYVPVPALHGPTWPLAWWSLPPADRRFVHPMLLRTAATQLLG